MSAGAQQFVTPLTLQTLSGQPVATDTFSLTQESEIGHIRLADQADAIVIAPATANVLGKLANGIADDLLTTVLLAARAPLVLAPAMNVHMWEHAAVQVGSVGTAREMAAALEEAFPGATVVIMTAAVADYRPRETYARKLKKDTAGLALDLERNPDILAGLGARKGGRLLVGFAAET